MDQRRLLLPVEGRHQGYGRRGEHEGESDLSLLRDDPVFLLFDLIWVRMPEEDVHEGPNTRKKKGRYPLYRSRKFAFLFPLPSFPVFYLTGMDDGPCVVSPLTLWVY